ncbi:hypothetical protein SAMN05660862_2501 [Sphingobacterium psychroaquaticum]|uniref:Lipoprotein n=1 Tax=Sphingobacterium psychroaquaticum TaxID=561061 RepID=A0A1X7K3U2_9SPHI|nr:hypothetical protein [Sphingobacterium psychroaquaticum]SMG35276.1 hypothetical protein SAMN05660862_2501 [Sphingobacterium psychroaquaticum]
MKRFLLLSIGLLFLGATLFSACAPQEKCAAYSTYPKKKSRTK